MNTDARRALTLVSKVVQNLAVNVPFSDREPFMIPFNPLIESNKPDYNKFIAGAMVFFPPFLLRLL